MEDIHSPIMGLLPAPAPAKYLIPNSQSELLFGTTEY